MKTKLMTEIARLRTGLALAAAIVVTTPAILAAESGPFVQVPFAEAQALAAKEGKVIFVDFFTTWCPPCKLLDRTTWQDPDVIKLLREKTVALKIDAEKERELAKKYRIDAYPTLLVTKADGTEIDRYVGYMEAAAFREALTATLAGKTSLQAARESVQSKDRPNPRDQMLLARKLADAGKNEEALELYLWCFDSGPDADPRFANTANSALPTAIGALGRKYPPALDALRTRRDALRTKVLTDPAAVEVETATRLAALDLALKDDAGIVAMLGKLPDGRARKAYGGVQVLTRLVEKKHYREALSLGSPEEEYGRLFEQTSRAIEMVKSSGRPNSEEMLKSVIKAPTTIGTIYVIALAGAGEKERALKLAETVLTNAGQDPEMKKLLRQGLIESGMPELAEEIVPESKGPTPEKTDAR